jgi:transposase
MKNTKTAFTDKVLMLIRSGKTLPEVIKETQHSAKMVLRHAALLAADNRYFDAHGRVIDNAWYTHQERLVAEKRALEKPTRTVKTNAILTKIVELVKAGQPAEQISEAVGVSRTLVYYYIKRAQQAGLLEGSTVMSQKIKMALILKDTAIRQFIIAKIQAHKSFDELVSSIGEHFGFAVSREMVTRLMKKLQVNKASLRRKTTETTEQRVELRQEARRLLKLITERFPAGTRSFVAKWLYEHGFMRLRHPQQAQLILYLFLRQRAETPSGKKVHFSHKRSWELIKGIKTCLALGKTHIRRQLYMARKAKAAKAKQTRVENQTEQPVAPEAPANLEPVKELIAPWSDPEANGA